MPASDLLGPAPNTKKGSEALTDSAYLRHLHVDQAMNPAQISHQLGVNWWDVWDRLLELGINRTPPPKPFTVPELVDADTLRRLHVDEGKSLAAIAKQVGCSPFDVGRALHRHGIAQRTHHRVYPELADGDLLRRWYETEGLSASEIAAEVGCAPQTVSAALARHGIPARSARATRPDGLDDGDLLAALRADGLTIAEIADRVGASTSATRSALARHGLTGSRRSRYPQLDDVKALKRMAGEGLTASQIAGRIGCTSRAVRDAFARHRLHLPDHRGRYPKLDDVEYLDLMYNQRFLSASAIAADVGCSTSAVYGALRRAGIPTGTPPPAP